MESTSSREHNQMSRQLSIQRQIAQLQAQLLHPNAPSSHHAHAPAHASGLEDIKRKRQDVTVLAPASPEHKKRRVTVAPAPAVPSHNGPNRSTDEHQSRKNPNADAVPLQQPGPSNVLSKLSALSHRVPSPIESDTPMRTSSFADKASGAPARDDRLTLIEQLEPGPYKHKAPLDDPLFERLEPHSGIRLASRKLSHEDLQDYMTGRYYISPSRLYSVVRPDARGQVYDVPVFGDWVTIAVVAERSPIRVSRAPVTIGPGEARDADDPNPTPTSSSAPLAARKGKPGKKDEPPHAGRKYVNLTLINFGVGGKKGTSRGDAMLSLLLFESDTYDTVSRGDGLLPEKIYKGGSRGAFESMAKLREGSVIALLNPRVLKPLQKPGAPNVLALSPESAASVAVIGTARDLGMCGVVKRDGKPCGSWCDKRISDVCDYHVQYAVERCRAARPEFTAGTSGMGARSSSSQKRHNKAGYDPQRKWGLSPADGSGIPPSSGSAAAADGGATYVVAGHIVAGGRRDLFLNENVGREAQARAARQASSRDTDVALKRLLARDKEGMKAVQAARRFAKKKAREGDNNKLIVVADGKAERLGKEEVSDGERIDEECESGDDGDDDDGLMSADRPAKAKNAYSAQVIKELGFDPTLKSSRGRRNRGDDSGGLYSKLRDLASCREPDKIRLGPRPGGRVRSVVSAPKDRDREEGGIRRGSEVVVIPDGKEHDSFEGAVLGKPPLEGPHGMMVDLDESTDDDELMVG